MARYLIFGATGGVGSNLSRTLANEKHELLLLSRNKEKLAKLAENIGSTYETVDATDCNQVMERCEQAVAHWEQIDGIVNCVGSLLLKPVHLCTVEEWYDTLQTNLTSAFAIARAAGKLMHNTGGSIVLISAAAANIGLPNHEMISAAKAGINGLMRSAAATYAGNQLRFNCVAPGLVNTPLTARITQNSQSLHISEKTHALGHIGQPDDIVEMIKFLLDPKHNWITGQVFTIDGGLSAVKQLGQ